MWRRSLALAALLLLSSTFCEGAVPKRPVVLFLGASETAGYGLPSSALHSHISSQFGADLTRA